MPEAAHGAGQAAARGWLAAYAAWSGIPIGSVVLLLIHRLTGGRWGEVLSPVLRPAAGLTPLAALAFVPVGIALASLYPWAADPGHAPPGVALLYLHPTAFLARSTVALVAWSLAGLVVAAGRGGPLFAAGALLLHGVLISVIAVDWVLSLEPGFVSSVFAAGVAIEQVLAALAFAALLSPPALDEGSAGDLGGLLIAAMLGTLYIGLMSFIVAWYGDLPEKAEWYLRRAEPGTVWLVLAAIAAGALVPFGLLLNGRLRRSRAVLRATGALVLTGVALHGFWLIVPAFDRRTLPLAFAAASFGLLALVSAAVVRQFVRRLAGEPSHAG